MVPMLVLSFYIEQRRLLTNQIKREIEEADEIVMGNNLGWTNGNGNRYTTWSWKTTSSNQGISRKAKGG